MILATGEEAWSPSNLIKWVLLTITFSSKVVVSGRREAP